VRSSHPFGWSLPPGVTHQMIDDLYEPDPYVCKQCGGEDMGQGIEHVGFCPDAPEPPEYDDAA
jgi:hypothetical protein